MKPQILFLTAFCGAYPVMVSGILLPIDPVMEITNVVISLIGHIIILLKALTKNSSDATNSVILQLVCTLSGCVLSLLTMILSIPGLFGFYASLAFPTFTKILPELLNSLEVIPALSNVNQNIYIPCALIFACTLRDIANNAPPNTTSARDLQLFIQGVQQFFTNVNRTFTCSNDTA